MTTIRKPIFVVPLSLGTIATGNATASHPATHLGRPESIGLTWRTSGSGNAWVRGDFGSAKEVDFCALVSANATSSTTIRLRLGDSQAEVDGSADYDSSPMTFINPSITRTDGLYHSHHELPSTYTKRWWRVDIGSHSGDFEGATLVLGKRIEPARFYNRDFEYGTKDLGALEFTRWGVPDMQPGAKLRTLEFMLEWLTEAELEASFRPMAEALGETGIVYCCFDPEATAYRQARTYMGKFGKPLVAKGRPKPRTFGQDFVIHSII
jgi:hypothetical protein